MPPPQISKSSVFLGLGYFSPTTQLKSTIASFPVHLSVTQCVILPQSTSLCLIPTAYVCFLLSGFLLLPASVLSVDPVTYPAPERRDSLWYLKPPQTPQTATLVSSVSFSPHVFTLVLILFNKTWSRIHSNS